MIRGFGNVRRNIGFCVQSHIWTLTYIMNGSKCGLHIQVLCAGKCLHTLRCDALCHIYIWQQRAETITPPKIEYCFCWEWPITPHKALRNNVSRNDKACPTCIHVNTILCSQYLELYSTLCATASSASNMLIVSGVYCMCNRLLKFL